MDSLREETCMVTKFIRTITCDECGKFINEIEVFEDGCWVNDEKYERMLSIVGSGCYAFRKDLCQDCARKWETYFWHELDNLGFEKV